MLSTSKDNHCQIKIATFNLFNFIAPPDAFYEFENIYTQEQWQKKCDWIKAYITEYQPDVIGFQEVFSPEELATLAKSCGLTYFAVVESPKVVDGYIHSQPVVAVASRYPIEEVTSVKADKVWAQRMGLREHFEFSRKPIRATIKLPQIGLCDCYVVHFKSKRSLFVVEDFTTSEISEKVHETQAEPSRHSSPHIGQALAVESLGQWSSSIQRGSEAVLLRWSMVERRRQTKQPMVLMGDFNDLLSDGVLAGLSSVDSRVKPQTIIGAGAEGSVEYQLGQYRLKDAYDLYQEGKYSLSGQARAATHYYFAKGSVLDYILLSSEFDSRNDLSIAEVSCYETYDRHLINPSFEHDSQSTDHAPVMITVSMRE